MPVIAAIDGYALGGGAELAYAADIRIGTPALKIGNPETGLGIIAAAGATWRLREIVGEARASELLLTGRILDADEALAVGLVSSLHRAGRAARRRPRDRRPDRGQRPAGDPAHQDGAARRRATRTRDRPRAAGRAVREPREAAPHDRVPREEADDADSPDDVTAARGPPVVGVLGGGRMGAGIAHAFLLAGAEVVSSSATSRQRMPRPPASATSLAPRVERGTTTRTAR